MIPTLDFVRGDLFNRILTEYHIVQTSSSLCVPSSTVTLHDSYTGFREGGIFTEFHLAQISSSFRVPLSTVIAHDSYTAFQGMGWGGGVGGGSGGRGR